MVISQNQFHRCGDTTFEALTIGFNALSVQQELPNKVHPPLFCECFLR